MSALGLLAAAASAWTMGFSAFTLPTESNLRLETPGLYVRHSTGWTAGALHNGAGHWDVWAGRSFETADQRFALTLGAAVVRDERMVAVDVGCKHRLPTGEPPRPVVQPVCRTQALDVATRLVPMVVPSLRVPLQELAAVGLPQAALRVALVPRYSSQGTGRFSAGVLFSLEAPLGQGGAR